MKYRFIEHGYSRVQVDPKRLKTLRGKLEVRYAPEMTRAKGLRYLFLRCRLNWEYHRAARKLRPSPYSLFGSI